MDLGQFVKDGFKKVSEAAMDALVSSIVANQEQHLGNLQEMQKWGIVKIIQRFTSYKYLHREPCVIPVTDCSIMDALSHSLATPTQPVLTGVPSGPERIPTETSRFERCRRRISVPSVGHLGVLVGKAKLLLLGHSLTTQDAGIQKFEWKVVVSCDRQAVETQSSIMARQSASTQSGRSGGERKVADAYTPLHEVDWQKHLQLNDIHDIWSDICVDVLWKKVPTPSSSDKAGKQPTTRYEQHPSSSSTESPAPIKEISPSTPRQENNQQVLKDRLPPPAAASQAPVGKEEVTATATSGQKTTLSSDIHPSKKKPPGEKEWKFYGRAIVPLSTLLSSYGAPKAHSATMRLWASAIYGMPDAGDEASFWLHLFPHDSSEKKYYRPLAGYPGFAMPNPGSTLGFLQITFRFNFTVPLVAAPVLSTFHAPSTRWATAMSFEPQYLETYALRARHLMTTYPRWVPKFFHLISRGGAAMRNANDVICVSLFWTFLLYGCLFASVSQVPLCVSVCLMAASLSYRVGHQAKEYTHSSLLYRRHQQQQSVIKDTIDQGYEGQVPLLRSSPSSRSVSQCLPVPPAPLVLSEEDGVRPSTLLTALESPVREPSSWVEDVMPKKSISVNSGEELSGPSLENEEASNLGFRREGKVEGVEGPVLDGGGSGSSIRYTAGHTGAAGTCRLDRLPQYEDQGQEQSLSRVPGTPPVGPVILTRRSLDAVLPSQVAPTAPTQLQHHHPTFVSVVGSPFGPLALTVHDPTSPAPEFPVFADDVGEQDVHALLEKGLEMLDGVQRMTGLFSFVIEKLKFAFNWDDPFTSGTSLFVMAFLSVSLTVCLTVLSYLPSFVLRLLFLFPVFLFILLTEPWIQEHLWARQMGIDFALLWLSLFSRPTLSKRTVQTETQDGSKGVVSDPVGSGVSGRGVSRPPEDSQHKSPQRQLVGGRRKDDGRTHAPSGPMPQSKPFSPPRKLTRDLMRSDQLPSSSSVAAYIQQVSQEEEGPLLKAPAVSTWASSFATLFHSTKTAPTVRGQGTNKEEQLTWYQRGSFSDGSGCRVADASSREFTPSTEAGDLKYRRGAVGRSDSRSESPGPQNEPFTTTVPPLEVFHVTATILPSTTLSTLGRVHTVHLRHKAMSCCRRVIACAFRGLQRFVLKPLTEELILLCLRGLGVMDLVCRFLLFWWLRLPDRREVEHRQIAATQYVESLEELLPSYYAKLSRDHLAQQPTRSPAGSGTSTAVGDGAGVLDTREETSGQGPLNNTDRYLDEYFAQQHANRNLISGLMNLRLLNVMPEHALDLSDILGKGSSVAAESRKTHIDKNGHHSKPTGGVFESKTEQDTLSDIGGQEEKHAGASLDSLTMVSCSRPQSTMRRSARSETFRSETCEKDLQELESLQEELSDNRQAPTWTEDPRNFVSTLFKGFTKKKYR